MGTLVVDAQPLLAVLLGEPGAVRVKEALRTHRASGSVLLGAVSCAEVLYVARRRRSAFTVSRVLSLLNQVPLSIVEVDQNVAGRAADLKVRFNLGLGDSFAAALALMTDSPLLTGDADFLPLAEHGLTIEWVGD